MNPTKMLPSERHGIPLNSISSAILDAERHPTNAKHTPGPWENHKWNCEEHQISAKGGTIALVSHSHSLVSEAEADANARLMASAPDLLSALKSAVSYLEANRPKGNIREIFHQLNEYENGVMKPARAAIAQAEGGAQ